MELSSCNPLKIIIIVLRNFIAPHGTPPIIINNFLLLYVLKLWINSRKSEKKILLIFESKYRWPFRKIKLKNCYCTSLFSLTHFRRKKSLFTSRFEVAEILPLRWFIVKLLQSSNWSSNSIKKNIPRSFNI